MKFLFLVLLFSLNCNANECTNKEWEMELEYDGDVTTEEWADINYRCEYLDEEAVYEPTN